MTDNVSLPPPPARSVGFLSFVTTDESVARGQSNLWAIVETGIAIVAFWWVTLTVETWTIFWTSLFVAPLLLLRSEASVKQGVEWFENGFFGWRWPDDADERSAAEQRFERRALWVGGLIGLVLGAMTAHRLSITFLVGLEGWPAFWRGAEVSVISVVIAGAGAGAAAAAGARAGAGAAAAAGAGSAAGAAAGAVAAAAAGAAAAAVAGAGAGAVAGAVAGAGAVAVAVAGAGAGARAGAVAVAVFLLPAFALGIWLISVTIRFLATLRHPVAGFVALPANIRRLILFTAPGHAPDLLPGLPPGSEYRLKNTLALCSTNLSSNDAEERIIGMGLASIIPIWFIPGWAYRFILKSTMWFWWIGLFLGGAPDISEGTRGLKADHLQKWWHWAVVVASAAGLVTTAVVTLGPAAIGNSLSATPILPVLTVLVAFDFPNSPLLPTLITLNAALTIALIFWAQSIVVDAESAGRDVAPQMKAHAAVGKIKKTIGAMSIALILVYAPLHTNARRGWLPVSPFVASVLDGIYGKYAAALMPAPR